MSKMSEHDKQGARELDAKHKALYKNTDAYLKERLEAGQSHNPDWGVKEHEATHWVSKK